MSKTIKVPTIIPTVDDERQARHDRMPNVTFGDHGTSTQMGNYLNVCMKSTPQAVAEVHNRFFELFGDYPLSRSKFLYGEATFYSTLNGERSPYL